MIRFKLSLNLLDSNSWWWKQNNQKNKVSTASIPFLSLCVLQKCGFARKSRLVTITNWLMLSHRLFEKPTPFWERQLSSWRPWHFWNVLNDQLAKKLEPPVLPETLRFQLQFLLSKKIRNKTRWSVRSWGVFVTSSHITTPRDLPLPLPTATYLYLPLPPDPPTHPNMPTCLDPSIAIEAIALWSICK